MQTATRIRLEVLEIAEPCPADWNAMSMVDGDRVRHCRHCAKNVYNISEMSREAAEELVASRCANATDGHESICVRMYKRADGTVTTADCKGRWRTSITKWARRWSAPVGAALSIVLAMLGCDERTSSIAVMGDVIAPPQVMTGIVAPTTRPATTEPEMLQGEISVPTSQPTTMPVLMGKIGPAH